MRYKIIESVPETYILVFETGDELAKGLKDFAVEKNLSAASLKAVGALSSARLGWYDLEHKSYVTSVQMDEQVELLSLIGDVALRDGEPQIHAHLVVGRRDGTAHGGHLLEAHVRPTCEVVLVKSHANLQKHVDPESGLAVIVL